jgi:hypothetical protein
MATAKRGQESIQIAAAPVEPLTAVVLRAPLTHARDGAHAAEVGARFRGYNRLGRFGWPTTAVVTAAQRGHEFAFAVVHDKSGRDETLWRYRLEPTSGGTLLTESFEFVWCPVGNRAVELFSPRGSQVNRGIHETLQRIAETASAPVVPSS